MGTMCLRLRHRGARRGRRPRGVSGGGAQCMCLPEEGAYMRRMRKSYGGREGADLGLSKAYPTTRDASLCAKRKRSYKAVFTVDVNS